MTALPNILAIDLPGGIEAIVMLIMAVLVAAGNLLKKKKPKSDGGQGEGISPLVTESPPDQPEPQARPSAPGQSGVVRPQPMSGARARPASTARQQLPQARPTPIARQQLPQARPTPIQQPATRQRVVGERRQPAEPVLPGSAPPRVQPPLESKPPQRPKSGLRAEREDHRVHAADHAKRLATRAEHTTSRLKEKQMRKAGELGGLDEHAHGEQQPLPSQSNPLHRLLKATGMKQAIILSEIVQPPLALRESSQSLF